MAGDIEFGACDICYKEAPLNRTYYRYDIKCECHTPTHFEIVRHCENCKPREPRTTQIRYKTSDLIKLK